ncbi:MAG: anthranilate synthase component I [Actinomycetota bacterium]|nr:anthranilate synthase component I [Actinomycetota bacterium]
MSDGAVRPSREEFTALIGSQPVVAVTRRLLADGETPVGVYRKLAGGPGSFMLESAEHGGVWSRYSFVGVHCPSTLTARDGRAQWLGTDPFPGRTSDELRATDPLGVLRDTLERLRSPRQSDLPPLTGGLVGYIGYDAVRRLERLPSLADDDLGLPELAMMLVSDLAVLDHSDGSVLLVANVIGDNVDLDDQYDDAVARLDSMTSALAGATPPSVSTVAPAEPDFESRSAPADYKAAVRLAKEQIRAGEAFQIVVAQRFQMSTCTDPLNVYRVLRAGNPSPYMYLLRFPDGTDVVGSSPEAHVKVQEGRALMRPIAGSRPRGATPEEDARLAAELIADPKERSEHVMLVDLARNDLSRVCQPDSVEVVELMQVERYSHIMHIVSMVVGDLAPGATAYDALAATFPAGTLSGAPKPRAMEIIEELEPTRRGLYGGVVGYFDVAGDLDSAIAIRTALIRNGIAYVQAGAGIVADSDPDAEHEECLNKARAVLHAIAAAGSLTAVQ